jgi:syntaxin 18
VGPAKKDRQYFTDPERDEIDAESKQVLRDLNGAIKGLADVELYKQNTAAAIAKANKQRNQKGVLGRWAAGNVDGPEGKTEEEVAEEMRANGIKQVHEAVLWYLRRNLEECGELQRSMMETRLIREVEKSKSVLYKVRGAKAAMNESNDDMMGGPSTGGLRGSKAVTMDETERRNIEEQLGPEQLQLFAQENQEMLKHYEDTLDQVRYAYVSSSL